MYMRIGWCIYSTVQEVAGCCLKGVAICWVGVCCVVGVVRGDGFTQLSISEVIQTMDIA